MHATSPVYQPIALTGTDGIYGPNQGPGITFVSIGGQQPSFNDSGQAIFRASNSLAGTPQGVWTHSSGLNTNVAIAGGPRPGGGTYPTGSSSVFNSTLINNAGQTAFRLGAQTGLFSDVGSGMDRVALAGDIAPGTGSATYATSAVATGTPLFNQAGQTAYIGNLTTGTGTPPVVITAGINNASGIWSGTPGTSTLKLRQNDAMLSLDAGGNVRAGSFSNLTMGFNGNGRFITVANLQGNVQTGNTVGNDTMIVSDRGGSVEVVARRGNAAPDATGSPSANNFRSFSTSQLGFNDNGRVAFSGTLRDAAGVQSSTGAFFTDTGTGTLRMVANAGQALPVVYDRNGNPLSEFSGVTWGISYNNPVINDNDLLVFSPSGLGNTGGTNNTGGIFSMDPLGTITKIMRNGDIAVPGGAPDGSNAFFLSPGNIQLNDAGQIAFTSTLTGLGVSVGLGNGNSLWATDLAGELVKIARTGDLFEVLPGDFRLITGIGGLNSTGGQDGHAISFNAAGMLAFELDFSDGSSGIFTASVPEPATALLLAAGMVVCVRRKRDAR